MRAVVTTVVAVCLLAAPGRGVVNVAVTADGPIVNGSIQLAPGATTTVRVWAQGTGFGLFALAGNISASGPADLTAQRIVGFGWNSLFNPIFNKVSGMFPAVGTSGTNGGWNAFGSWQTNYQAPDPNLAKSTMVDLFDYTVKAGTVQNTDITLTFAMATVDGYWTSECDRKSPTIGIITPVTIHVTPEPATLFLLTIGGLLLARRRLT